MQPKLLLTRPGEINHVLNLSSLPLCYSAVRKSDFRINQHSFSMPKEQSRDKERMRVVREIALLKTLAVTICAFLICWLPYGIIALFFADTVPPQVKKVITNVCLGDNTFCLILCGLVRWESAG